MPVNHALLRFCIGAVDHKLLRGNVIVLKQPQLGNRFVNMTTDNINLVGSLVGRYVLGNRFQFSLC